MASLHAHLHPLIGAMSYFAMVLTLAGSSACLTAIILTRLSRPRLRAYLRFQIVALALAFPATSVAAIFITHGLLQIRTAEVDGPPFETSLVSGVSLGTSLEDYPEISCFLASIWLAGILALLFIEAARRIGGIALPNESHHHDVTRRIHSAIGPSPYPITISSGCADPMVVGLLRPRIVIPVQFAARLSDQELRAVLAHELAHCYRRDNALALLLRLMAVLFWFDPLRWFALTAAMDERERACDEHVVESGHDPQTYVNAMLKSCGTTVSYVASCVTSSRVASRLDSITTFTQTSFVSPRIAGRLLLGSFFVGSFAIAAITPNPLNADILQAVYSEPRLEVTARLVNRALDAAIEVRDRDGHLISAPRITVPVGTTSAFSTIFEDGGRTTVWHVTVQGDVTGRGTVRLEVIEDGSTVHTSEKAFRSSTMSEDGKSLATEAEKGKGKSAASSVEGSTRRMVQQ